MTGLSSNIKWLRSRYPKMLRILTGNSNQSSKAIPFFQPSYMPYQVSSLKLSPSTLGQQAPNQPAKEGVHLRGQRIERAASGIGGSLSGQTTPLLPKMLQHPMLPSPESRIRNQIQKHEDSIAIPLETPRQEVSAQPVQKGVFLKNQQKIERKSNNNSKPVLTTEAVQILPPKTPQYQRLPLLESRIRNQTQKHKEDSIAIPLETPRQEVLARPVQKGVSLKNQQKIERKSNNNSKPVLTTEAVQILLPTMPQNQHLPSLSKEHYKAVAVCEGMNAIRALCAKYHEDNIYNMDEVVLSWRHALYDGLVPESAKDGSQITLALCVNATGSDRLPVYVITSEKKPSSIDGLDPKAFGAAWQSNDKLAMTAETTREWLHLFYSHIGKQRKVILLLDNLNSHKKGVELMPPPPNIRIQWLPPGTTRRYQPLDQGINKALKVNYQQIWIKYMFGKLYGGEFMNPVHTMSSELAVRWTIQIWKHHITSKTVHDCFRKSSILQPLPSGPASKDVPDPAALQSGSVNLSKNT